MAATRREKHAKLIVLVESWLADESGYDEETWPRLKAAIERNRLSYRKCFNALPLSVSQKRFSATSGNSTGQSGGQGHVEPTGAMPRSLGPEWIVMGWRCVACREWISEDQMAEACSARSGAVPGGGG